MKNQQVNAEQNTAIPPAETGNLTLKADHTPGPWKVRAWPRGNGKRWGLSITTADEPDVTAGLIADVSGEYKQGRVRSDVSPLTEANARLIAAAPALVAALQLLKRHTLEHFGNVHHNHGSKDMARALDAADAALVEAGQ